MKERGEMVEERSVVSEDEKDEINHYNKKNTNDNNRYFTIVQRKHQRR